MGKFNRIDAFQQDRQADIIDIEAAYLAGDFDNDFSEDTDWIYDAYEELGLGSSRSGMALD